MIWITIYLLASLFIDEMCLFILLNWPTMRNIHIKKIKEHFCTLKSCSHQYGGVLMDWRCREARSYYSVVQWIHTYSKRCTRKLVTAALDWRSVQCRVSAMRPSCHRQMGDDAITYIFFRCTIVTIVIVSYMQSVTKKLVFDVCEITAIF